MLIRNAKDSAGKAIEVLAARRKNCRCRSGAACPGRGGGARREGPHGPARLHRHPLPLAHPGFEYKEDISTGSAAAAAGGYTFVNLDAQHEAGLLQCRDRPRRRG